MSDKTLAELDDTGGSIPEEFVLLVRDALTHLYDFAHLQVHPLARLVTGHPGTRPEAGKALRALLLDTLEQLNPGDSVSRNDKEWRPYGILMRRYADGFEVEQIMSELGVSLRQFQRDHRKGLLAVASALWGAWQDSREAEAPAPDDDLRREVDRLGLALGSVDLGALVASSVPPAQALAKGAGVELRVEGPAHPLLAWADPMLARQALLGALSALITAQPAMIDLRPRATGAHALIELRLSGPLALPEGVSGSLEARLAAMGELMQAQGGDLEMETDAENLSGVKLSFRPAQGACILLVDDNEGLLQLFERYLAAEGYRVMVASGAPQALAAIERERPEAIVVDVMMRQVDGWQLLQRMRANPTLQDVPIIVCSVLNEPELAYALGAQCYLKKPVSQEQLLAALSKALDESSPAAVHPEAS